MINQSLSDRLDLGQNSLPGAQHIIVATKHNDQMPDIPDHLRWLSLGEDIETTGHNRRDRKIYSIWQVDGLVNSRDSLSLTPDSVDLTVSPEKYWNKYADKGNKNTDTNDKDMNEILEFNKEKTTRTYGKDKMKTWIAKTMMKMIHMKLSNLTRAQQSTQDKCWEKEIIKTKKKKSNTECKR